LIATLTAMVIPSIFMGQRLNKSPGLVNPFLFNDNGLA
jgi:branched-subunit amino acid transport protein